MRYRQLTSSGDMTFGSGQLNFLINSPETVAQAVQTGLLLWIGEWYLNLDEGTPYMQGIIGMHSKVTADATIRARILSTQGMISIENYSSTIDPDNRKMSVSVTLNTIYGITDLQVQNYANY